MTVIRSPLWRGPASPGYEAGIDLTGQILTDPVVGPCLGVAKVKRHRLPLIGHPVPGDRVQRVLDGAQGSGVVRFQPGDRPDLATLGRSRVRRAADPAQQLRADLVPEERQILRVADLVATTTIRTSWSWA